MIDKDRQLLQHLTDVACSLVNADGAELTLLGDPLLRVRSGDEAVCATYSLGEEQPADAFGGNVSTYLEDPAACGSIAVLPITGPSAEAGWLTAMSVEPDRLTADSCNALTAVGVLVEGVLDRFVEQSRLDQLSETIRRSQIDLRTTQERLRESNAELEQFAYIAAHELVAPLRAVGLHAELLAAMLPDDDFSRSVQVNTCAIQIRSGINEMDELLEYLLQLSKIQATSTLTEPTDLGQVIKGVLDDLASELADVGADVIVPDMPIVAVRPVPMQSVFANLLTNAIRHRDPERQLEIRIRAAEEGDGWRISVIDNGSGIDPADSSRLFGLFERGSSPGEGNGIGLGVSQRVVESFGGRIGVEPNPAQGSEFWVWLPKA